MPLIDAGGTAIRVENFTAVKTELDWITRVNAAGGVLILIGLFASGVLVLVGAVMMLSFAIGWAFTSTTHVLVEKDGTWRKVGKFKAREAAAIKKQLAEHLRA